MSHEVKTDGHTSSRNEPRIFHYTVAAFNSEISRPHPARHVGQPSHRRIGPLGAACIGLTTSMPKTHRDPRP